MKSGAEYHIIGDMPKKHTEKKKLVIRTITVILTLLSFVLIGLFLVRSFSGEHKLNDFFFSFYQKNKVLTYFLFLFLSPIINILPGISSMFFISLGNLLFNDMTIEGMLRTAFIISLSVILTSSLLFLIGRFGGKKLISWLLDDKDIHQTKKLLTIAGKAGLPLMYLLPGFPDDTLSLVMGMTDMPFLYNLVCTVLFRTSGVFVITFLGSHFIPFETFTLKQWVIFVLSSLGVLALLLFVTFKYYQYLRKKEEGIRYLLIKGLRVSKQERKFRKRIRNQGR